MKPLRLDIEGLVHNEGFDTQLSVSIFWPIFITVQSFGPSSQGIFCLWVMQRWSEGRFRTLQPNLSDILVCYIIVSERSKCTNSHKSVQTYFPKPIEFHWSNWFCKNWCIIFVIDSKWWRTVRSSGFTQGEKYNYPRIFWIIIWGA